MELNVRVLGSSSAGNCTLILDDSQSIMIDCGFSPGYIYKNLKNLSLGVSALSGLLITHTHGDHVNEYMVDTLIEKGIPVFCPRKIVKVLIHEYDSIERAHDVGLLRTIDMISWNSDRLKSIVSRSRMILRAGVSDTAF